MRAVADHHVDRPEVHAQQCVQLTGTNRPTGFDPIRKQADPRPGRSTGLGRRHADKTGLVSRGKRPGAPAPPSRSPVRFAGLVVRARAKHPIPSRTRPLSAAAPMVLRPKTRESRSPPNLESAHPLLSSPIPSDPGRTRPAAGWSSPVARQAHNLKVVGSNPTPATNRFCKPRPRKAATSPSISRV